MAKIDPKTNIVSSSVPYVPFPNEPIAKFLHDRFEAVIKDDPNRVAFIEMENNKQQLTYQQLQHQAEAFACGLAKLGITKNDKVELFGMNSNELLTSLIGTFYLGTTFYCERPTAGSYEFEQNIISIPPSVLIISEKMLPILESILNDIEHKRKECVEAFNKIRFIVVLDCDQKQQSMNIEKDRYGNNYHVITLADLIAIGNERKFNSIPLYPFNDLAEDPLLIVLTSGTTGSPKGVVHTNCSLGTNMISLERILLKLTYLCQWFSIAHCSGLIQFLYGMMVTCTMLFHTKCDMDTLFATAEQYKLTTFSVPPHHALKLLDIDYREKYDLNSLKIIVQTGMALHGSLIKRICERYNFHWVELYGATETIVPLTNYDRSLYRMGYYSIGNLGSLQPSWQLKIIDIDTGKVLPPNHVGELCLRGPGLFHSYWNNPIETDSVIDHERWYFTKDICHVNNEGCVFITDRVKELIKFQSHSIIPAQIERFLAENDAIEKVCVVGVPHPVDVNWLRAYVQLKPNSTVTEEELIKLVEGINFCIFDKILTK